MPPTMPRETMLDGRRISIDVPIDRMRHELPAQDLRIDFRRLSAPPRDEFVFVTGCALA